MKLLSTVAPDLRGVFVHGKAKKALIEAKQLIEQNGLDVIVSTDVLATGTDIPEIMSLVNLAGMKAEIGVIQKVGRAARKYKDGQDIKSSFEVFDLLDIGTDPEHQSHKWLMEHADDRLASYRSLGFGVNIL
jgi:superfamily II DNA or RNA helicase